jgi:hypothetical protein
VNDAEILQRADSVETNARVYEHESLLAWQGRAQKRDEYESGAGDQSEDANDYFSVHARWHLARSSLATAGGSERELQ